MGTKLIDRKVNSTNSHELAVISTDYATPVLILVSFRMTASSNSFLKNEFLLSLVFTDVTDVCSSTRTVVHIGRGRQQ